MDISFQPKSTMPEEVKSGPTTQEVLADIAHMYVGPEKSIITLILTSALALVLVAIGGMSVALSTLANTEAEKAKELSLQDSQVVKLPIEEVRKLSSRLKVIDRVVKGQPFPTTFLKSLEYVVENDIVFEKANLAYLQSSDTYTLDIDANGPSYKSILNQREAFKLQPYNSFFSESLIRNIAIDKTGKILFKVTSKVKIRGVPPEDAEAVLGKASASQSSFINEGAATSTPTGTSTGPTSQNQQ